jgi:hypothetical protein
MSGQRQMNAEMPVSLLTTIPNGTIREVDGRRCIWFDGYWIRHYDVPQNEDVARRELHEAHRYRHRVVNESVDEALGEVERVLATEGFPSAAFHPRPSPPRQPTPEELRT